MKIGRDYYCTLLTTLPQSEFLVGLNCMFSLRQMKTKEIIGQAHTLVKELCSGLSNLHTYTEQRSKIFPIDSATGPVSMVNQKVSLIAEWLEHLIRASNSSHCSVVLNPSYVFCQLHQKHLAVILIVCCF